MTRPNQLEVALPSYCTRGRMYLGAPSCKRPEFTIANNP
jgi:hypothetical protein